MWKYLNKVLKTTCLSLSAVLFVNPLVSFGDEVEDSMNAMMLSMKAKTLVGHQTTTSTPGSQTESLRSRRGGPQVSPHQEAGCGGVAIGNVRPVLGDHRQHSTTVIIQGHIYNTGNNC